METQKVKTTPSDFFLHLGIIVALYISTISLINLFFTVINKVFPDALALQYGYYDSSGGTIRWAVAALIIMFPLYLILGYIFTKQIAQTPEKKSVGVRKWLVYLTLFISGLTLAIDLITLVYNLLGGEITTRFVLKVLVIIIVAGLIFIYYLFDARKSAETHAKRVKLFASIALALVVLGIAAGFVLVGSPLTQRKIQFDEQRISDLQNIQSQVVGYWQAKGKLPQNLSDLNNNLGESYIPTDPQTNKAYEYFATGNTTFNLCANFATIQNSKTSAPTDYFTNNWNHAAGRVCFERTIDPDLYPVQPKPAVK